MNNELIIIIHAIQSTKIPTSIHICDKVVNDADNSICVCMDIDCGNCPIQRGYKVPGKYFATQMTLTMEAVNHETRNPTSD